MSTNTDTVKSQYDNIGERVDQDDSSCAENVTMKMSSKLNIVGGTSKTEQRH